MSNTAKIKDTISKAEMEKLLEITNLISSSKSQFDLLKNIIQATKPLFNFVDCGLFVLSKDGKTHCDWAALYPDLSPSEWNDVINMNYAINTADIPNLNSPVEWMMSEIDKKNNPVLTDFIDLCNNFPNYQQFEGVDIVAIGYRDCLAYNLKENGKNIGFFCINATAKNFFKESQFPLFKAITNIIASAVSSILYHQEIIENNRIKSRLLEITEDITTSNTEIDLIKVIIEKIKPIFNFHDCGLFVLSQDGQTHSDWAAIYEDVSPSEWNEKIANVSKSVEHKNSLIEFMINEIEKETNTILFDFVDLIKKFPNYPHFEGIDVLDMPYRDCLMYTLKSEGKIIGCFCINALSKDFFKPSQFEIFQSVTNIIAIAVKNIITNESLAKVATIKSVEVELIKKLAGLQDWETRLLEVNKILQPFISNSMFAVNFEINDNKYPVYAFLRTGKNEYQTLLKDDFLRITKIKEEVFTAKRSTSLQGYNAPFILQGKSLEGYNKNDAIKEQICLHFGFKSNFIYGIKLEKYGKVILAFYGKTETDFNENHFEFLKNLESTLSLVLDRILASEEIEKLNSQLAQENLYLQEEVNNKLNFESIIGSSDALQEVFRNVDLVANTDTTVLVLGETGTGKELIARSLHNLSTRKSNSFIKVNCAALPAQLIESELFGHEKGSFTGAFEKRIGKFELADKGSIFLDEIGELPLELQAKLLRVIQEKEFERIGGNVTIKCDVRVIAATNRILENEVEKGNFRADLYYRLNVFPIKLPPLRERTDDIPLLATYFGQKFSKRMNKPFKGINLSMLEALTAYEWPGNIRELENVMEQAVIVNQGNNSLELARQLLFVKQNNQFIQNNEFVINNAQKSLVTTKKEREIAERNAIIETLTATKGRVRGAKGAAILLDVQPTTLESKMKKYVIFKDEFGMLGQD